MGWGWGSGLKGSEGWGMGYSTSGGRERGAVHAPLSALCSDYQFSAVHHPEDRRLKTEDRYALAL